MYEIEAKNISVTAMINNHRRQSGVNSAGARRGFSGILLQNTYIHTNLKQIPGDDRKSDGASAPPAPPSLAPMWKCV